MSFLYLNTLYYAEIWRWTMCALTLKGPGGGIRPPLDVSRDNFVEIFFRAASFHDFFLSSLAQLLALFSEKSGVRFQSYATLCNLTIFWICVQTYMENGFLCQNSILSSKMQYLLSLQLKSLLYLLIFNTQTIPYKKPIKYISRKNKEIHKKFAKQ